MKMKRMIIALMMFVLCLTTAAPAFSAGGTVTINNTVSGDTYGVYQIVAGDIADGYTWGEGINETGKALLGDPAGAAKQLSGTNGQEIVKTLKSAVGTPSAQQTASGDVNFSGLAPGLYVICNMTRADDYRVKLLMGRQVIDLFEEKRTSEMTESKDNAWMDKSIETQRLTVSQTLRVGDQRGQTIDAAIGDVFSTRAEGRFPNNLDAYDNYQYALRFSPGEGITLHTSTAVIEVDGETRQTGYRVIQEDDGSVYVIFENLKSLGIPNGAVVTVTMDGALNGNALTGAGGNPISLTALYGNDAQISTEPSTTTVYTYTLEGMVRDSETKAGLGGAQFHLYRSKNESFWSGVFALLGWDNREYLSIDAGFTTDAGKALVITSDENGGFSVKGLGGDKYYLEETKAPEEYEGIKEPAVFEIQSVLSDDGSGTLNVICEAGESSGHFESGTVSLTLDTNRLKGGEMSSGAGNTADPANTAGIPEGAAGESSSENNESAKDSASPGDNKNAVWPNEVKSNPSSQSDSSVQPQSGSTATSVSPTVAPAATAQASPDAAPVETAVPQTTAKQQEPTPTPAEKKGNAKTGTVSRGGSFAVVVVLLIVAGVIYAIWKRKDDYDVTDSDKKV